MCGASAGTPLATPAEEAELASRIAAGDGEARTRLILANLRLVVKIARGFEGLGLPMEDLVSEGNIGLMRAADRFDPAKGAKFSVYASWWIKQAMRFALAERAATIRIPVGSARKIGGIRAARARLAERLGREPTVAETAAESGFGERTVASHVPPAVVSLHDPALHGGDGEWIGVVPDTCIPGPDRIAEMRDTFGHVLALVGRLPESERRVVGLYFGLAGGRPQTFDAIGRAIRRTRERARQIHRQALGRLRGMLWDESPDNGLDPAAETRREYTGDNPRRQVGRASFDRNHKEMGHG